MQTNAGPMRVLQKVCSHVIVSWSLTRFPHGESEDVGILAADHFLLRLPDAVILLVVMSSPM